ncbi:MAG: cytochrome c biogenesis protein ResB [Acidobacteria bacterium]|nr:cytochrome c biogenesis protein ResB [Acidobacteriota bacterium]
MSAIEETKPEIGVKSVAAAAARPNLSVVTRALNLLSSVRFGVTLLMIAVAFSMIGMLVIQKNVEGFDKAFADMTPASRLLWGSLGFFDIYHAWYFKLLLLTLSLNIVLASIDRFPGAWKYVAKPKLDANEKWLRLQEHHADLGLVGDSRESVVERIKAACKSVGMRARVTEKGGRSVVFAESGAWNRLGAYAVHVALLTIFSGGFLTGMLGHSGEMTLRPGMSSSQITEPEFNVTDDGLQLGKASVGLPFDVTCTDIQQKLIRQDGGIDSSNTIDWLTMIRIRDERGTHDALVHLNSPYDYRGYRFFQASFIGVGRARQITLRLTREADGFQTDVTIPRDGAVNLSDGTQIKFVDFESDFTMAGGQIASASGEYNNPAAILAVRGADGAQSRAYAFAQELPPNAPVGRAVAGYKFRLAGFEKVAEAHTLAIQRDPGATVFYVGSAMLVAALVAVFFFSHRRVWAIVEERGAGKFAVLVGGNANRNSIAFGDKFKRLVAALTGETPAPTETSEVHT